MAISRFMAFCRQAAPRHVSFLRIPSALPLALMMSRSNLFAAAIVADNGDIHKELPAIPLR